MAVRDLWFTAKYCASRAGSTLCIVAGALGIGLLTAVFGIADPFVLRPLPYAEPDELAVIQASGQDLPFDAEIPTVDEWRGLGHLFKGLAAHDGGRLEHARLVDRTAAVLTWRVSSQFFNVLGIPSANLGRENPESLATPAIVTPAGHRTLAVDRISILDPASGQGIRELIVVGVLPQTFIFPDPGLASRASVLIPFDPPGVLAVDRTATGERRVGRRPGPQLLARLQPGVTPKDVTHSLSRHRSGHTLQVRAEWLSDHMSRAARPLMRGMFAAAILVLLVCTGNIATLFIIRTLSRSREFLTRQALGAGGPQIARLWLLDLGMLLTASWLLGLVIAAVTLNVVSRVMPAQLLTFGPPIVTWRVVACAGAAALLMGLTCALATTFAVRRLQFVAAFRGPSHGSRARVVAAVTQCALATVLAIGAALLGRSYLNLINQDVGYDESATTVAVRYSLQGPAARSTTADVVTTVQALRSLPGIRAAAATPGPIVNGLSAGRTIAVNGMRMSVNTTAVTGLFFDATGMTVMDGRGFGDDDQQIRRSVVVNDLLAQSLWPNSRAVGQTIRLAEQDMQVIGVVRRAFDKRLDAHPTPTLYVMVEKDFPLSQVVYVVRPATEGPPSPDSIRRVIAEVRPDAIVDAPDTLQSRLLTTVRERTFAAFGLAMFGAVTICVAVSGIVAIVAFIAQSRTREIAVRMALGAQRGQVFRLVSREAVIASTIGVVIGVVIGRLSSQYLTTLVYGLEAGDWLTTIASAVFVVLTMVATAMLVVRRKVDLQSPAGLRVE